ncbi:MAG: LysR family transcriptional regulator [Xanthobacteraceae bacterium]
MDFRQLRTFVTVAELGTVSKAAMQLRIAQPALSRQIANLEQELGLKLFDRMGRRLALTSEGEQLLGTCRGLLSDVIAIKERAEELRRGDSGTLRLAAVPQFIEGVISRFLHRYAQRYPNVKVELIESIAWNDTKAMLDRREIHLGQNVLSAVSAHDRRFAQHTLADVELCAAGHSSLMTGVGETIEIARLTNYRLLVQDTSFASRRTFDAACRAENIEVDIAFESRTPHTLLAMAENGHGLALVPSAVQIDRYALQVARVTHKGKPLRQRLAIFWNKKRPLPRYAMAFCELLGAHVLEVLPVSRPSKPTRTGTRKKPSSPNAGKTNLR